MLWGLVFGLGAGAGVVGLVWALVGVSGPGRPAWWRRWRSGHPEGAAARSVRARSRVRLAAAAGVFLLLWLVTGVFVLAVTGGAAVAGVPWLLAPVRRAAVRIDQLEALAEWTQRLSNALRVGKGLLQAMKDSRTGCPAAIAGPVEDLAERLEVRVAPETALRAFADDVDDVAGDRVAAALILAVTSAGRGRGLADSLELYAAAVRAEVASRQKIEAERKKWRTTLKILIVIMLGVVGIGLLIPSYTAPYGTLLGQLVLGVVALLLFATLLWVRQLSAPPASPRFLIADPRSAVTPPAAVEESEAGHLAAAGEVRR
ncbi:type II secretion system F family protein [Streptomyces smyrnaeus]|uniref:Type II secretion system F family protein n=1 Tax=Streptomyces smyrnaeus TaxID=1387713 RepID=A0ABS3Y672_9ACTN|nr:type II secretion system F family protein [Streptomyces smyrnaeus]MBO8203164.1 type II secretion system F family protein [Streptomyces smyrnaeus]